MRNKPNIRLLFGFIGIVLLCVVVGAAFLSATAGDQSKQPKLRAAPLNPEFVRYISQPQADTQWPEVTADGYPLGHIPAPVDVDYYYMEADQIIIDDLAAKYDLRTKNKLTSVKNQGACGSCWSFATYAALESSLLPGQTWNFSEQHLIKKHGLAWGPCKVGNVYIALAYLSQWLGPVKESDMPYTYLPRDMAAAVQKHVQAAFFAPKRKSNTDNTKIKKLVSKYGAVYTSMYYDSSRFNYATNAYYNVDTEEGSHAVAIVGWDNNYSKNNFQHIPPNNGAFIVRNSWGPNWGENGYFYVSYCDKYFGRRSFNVAYKKPEAVTNYSRVYNYDPSGWVNTIGYGSETAWFANIFTAKAKENIAAVSFYGPGLTNAYTVYVYTGVSANAPSSGTLVTQKSGKFSTPGYFTVKLNQNIPVLKNEKFSVVVKLKTKGTGYPIAIEARYSGYTKNNKCKAKKGQSFIGTNGSSWADACVAWQANTNVCLKAFAVK